MEPCLDDDLKLDYLNGALSGGERALFEKHLAACPACRREIDELRKTAAAVAGLTPPSIPAAWTAAAKDRLRAKALAAAVVPPGPALARRRTNVFQYAAIAAGVTGGLALLFELVMGSPLRSWLPDVSAALGITGPSAARAARLVVWILSLHALLLVPSIIDNIYRIARRGGRRSPSGRSPISFALISSLLMIAITSISAQDRSTLTSDEARKIIANGYLDWGHARLASDRETFEKMLAPGFTIQQPGRKLSRQQYIDGISSVRPNEKLTRYDITVLTVQTTSDGWVAIAQEKVEIESPDKNKGYSLKIIRAGWELTDQCWMITYMEFIGHENWTGGTKPPFADW